MIRVMFRDMEAAIEAAHQDYEARKLLADSDQHFGKYFRSLELLRGACRRTTRELNDAITELETASR